MPGRERRLEVGEIGERQRHVLELFLAQKLLRRPRLQREDGCPQRLLFQASPESAFLRHGEESVDDSRVEGSSALMTRQVERRLSTTELMQSLEEARGKHDARGKRDVIPTATAGPPPSHCSNTDNSASWTAWDIP